MQKSKKPIIISVGGSLIVQEKINTDFLQKLSLIIDQQVQNDERFILVAGGGRTARSYQSAIYEFYPDDKVTADWIGIHSTILNAQMLKLIFKKYAHPDLVGNPDIKYDWNNPILIGAGYEPGHSTDYDAVKLAITYGSNKIINLSNIDYVYDSDPRYNPNAERFETISWPEFRKCIPDEWTPGLSSPFDPTAAKLAEENNIEVAMINGFALDRLENYLRGDKFVGTRIHP